MSITAPAPIAVADSIESFECAEPSLTDWLKQRALKNEGAASRTYVVTDTVQARVIGYYCLAAGSVDAKSVTGAIRRNMPNPIPVAVLGRLAVDVDHTGKSIGRALLKDAIVRSMQMRRIVGARALLCHALHAKAGAFYHQFGFVASPLDPLTLMLVLNDALLDGIV